MTSNDYMYPDFLDSPSSYQKAEQYWKDLWIKINPLQRHIDKWVEPWMYTNSESIKDGNPIFSAVSRKLHRGVRIIQFPSEDNCEDLYYWFDTFGGGLKDAESIHELVIACILSNKTSEIVVELVKSWMTNGILKISFNKSDYFEYPTFGSFTEPDLQLNDAA